MCLEVLKKTYSPNEKEEEGFKVFFVGYRGVLLGDYKRQGKVRSEGVWLHEYDFRPILEEYAISITTCNTLMSSRFNKATKTYESAYYDTGFHFFKTEEDARNWVENEDEEADTTYCICHCKGKDIRARGIQEGVEVFVAKQLFIVKRII